MSPEWKDAGVSRAHLAAAFLQHRVAQAVVGEIKAKGQAPLEALAEHAGESVDYVRSKLYGHRPISLEDLMLWVEAVGVDILPTLDPVNFEDLLP
jgi:hypothetical protein